MFDWTTPMIIAICIAVVISALTMPAGIGGGVLYVPVLSLIGGMSQTEASAFSRILITGASIGSVMFQIYWQIHHKNEPLLAQPYYVVVIMPVFLSGSVIGVYLSNMLPSFVCLVVLVILCVVSSVMIFKKGIECYRKENLLMEVQRLAHTACEPSPAYAPHKPQDYYHYDAELTASHFELPQLQPINTMQREISLMSLDAGINCGTTDFTESNDQPTHIPEDSGWRMPRALSVHSLMSLRIHGGDHGPAPSIVESIIEEETQNASRVQLLVRSVPNFIGFVVVYWVILIVLTVVKGGPGNPSFAGIVPCGTVYWIVTGFQIISGVCFSLLVAWREIKLIMLSLGFGVIATISGASGGMLLNPLFLYLGLDPQQVAATSTIIMLVSSSSAAIEFLFTGKVEPILFTMMLATIAGSIVGMTLLTWAVQKFGRQSFLVFLLGGLVVIGGIMLVFVGTKDLIHTYNEGKNPFDFEALC